MTLRLIVELVPEPSWGRDLAKLAPRPAWRALREEVFKKHDGKCAICGAPARIAHEVWEYNDTTHVQRLREIIPICDLCNLVKHIGRTGDLVRRGLVDGEVVVQHFVKVNGCDRQTFEQHANEAIAMWRRRSQHEWIIDWGPFAHLIQQHQPPDS